MKFKYKGIEGRFIDFKVVETGFCFTWIRLQYELYENGEVYSQDWTEEQFGTFGYEPEFDDDEVEMSDEDIVRYVDDLFHEGYELADLIQNITRYSTGCGYEPVKGDADSIAEVCFHYIWQRFLADKREAEIKERANENYNAATGVEKIIFDQAKKRYPHYIIEAVEFEWEEDGEQYYNLIADGNTYMVKVNVAKDRIYWDKDL